MANKSLVCFYVLNAITTLCGLLLLALGLVINYFPGMRDVLLSVAPTVSHSQFGIVAILMVLTGSFIFFVSLVGFCGVINDTKCILSMYTATLVLLLIGQIAIGACTIAVAKQSFKNRTREVFQTRVNNYWSGGATWDREVVDTVQKKLSCCGNLGPQDYPNVTHTTAPSRITTSSQASGKTRKNQHDTNYHIHVPESCCKVTTSDEIRSKCLNVTLAATEQYFYHEGCQEKIESFIYDYGITVAVISFIIALQELAMIIFACYYTKKYTY